MSGDLSDPLRPQPIDDAEFRSFQTLVRSRAGIHLGEHKKALLVARLTKRLRALGLDSFRQYHKLVTAEGHEDEMVRMIDAICTNETRFFREEPQFSYLEEELYPTWRAGRPRRIRVWSAACSSGEEPYSLAMSLAWHFPASEGWGVEILASDLSTKALAQAREGIWSIERGKRIPERYLKRFMLRGVRAQVGKMAAGAEIRRLVRFLRLNLSHDAYPVAEPFDLIFCRNVLIYFDAAAKHQVVERLAAGLRSDGCLFLGQAEGLLGLNHKLQKLGPAIYGSAGRREVGELRC